MISVSNAGVNGSVSGGRAAEPALISTAALNHHPKVDLDRARHDSITNGRNLGSVVTQDVTQPGEGQHE
jgi:hypothetical protein